MRLLRISSGLFDLKGIDLRLSNAIASSIFNSLYIDNLEKLPQQALNYFLNKYGRVSRVGDIYPNQVISLFKDPLKERAFKNIPVYFNSGNELAFNISSKGSLSITLPFNLIIFMLSKQKEVLKSSFQEILQGVRGIVSHELRHAGDYILNESLGEGSSYDYTNLEHNDRNVNYFNHPSEMKSYAGNVAEDLFYLLKGDYSKLKDFDLTAFLKNKPAFSYLKSENKKIFLTRVYNEFQKLSSSGFKNEESISGKFVDSYATLRQIAKKFKNAKDFAFHMVPRWAFLKELYDRVKSLTRMGDYRSDYLFYKKKYQQIFKSYKDLISGKDPEALPEDDISFFNKTY